MHKIIEFLRDFRATTMVVRLPARSGEPFDLEALMPGPTSFNVGNKVEVTVVPTENGPVLVTDGRAVLDKAIQGQDFKYVG